MNNKCPKCGKKLSPFYLKQNCPNCNVDLLYYKLDERLEADAIEAKRQTDNVNHFLDILKSSSIGSPLHIIRLILFFTPLAPMCLPMFWAGHKNVSLITFILSIVNHGFDLGAMTKEMPYFLSVLSIILVIVLSLAEIINSLFSSTKKGFERNIIFSLVNTAVFGALSIAICLSGGIAKAGFYVTLAIYLLEFVLHLLCEKDKGHSRKVLGIICVIICVAFAVIVLVISPKPAYELEKTDYTADENSISVVSFNVASGFGLPLDDTDSMVRCSRFADYMNRVHPDSIGTQETNSFWLEELKKEMPDYDCYGVKRGGDGEEKRSEMNAVFWLKDKYTAVETNTFWLSETPNEESKYTYIDENGEQQEAGCYRICSYAVLKNNETNDMYIHLNTHLDNSSEQAADFGAQVIVSEIARLRAQYGENVKIVLSGDFNETCEGKAYKTIESVLTPCYNGEDIGCTYQEWGYRDTGNEPIDFIFTTGKSKQAELLNNISGGYVSDHYGIFHIIEF